ncbi:MAG: efflux RND transporter periplasmic adaptor subunit [Deltaproteobacteria bacterium]|nr:efflux RND transporter periplasmic adaptor subunit [Deltaproteobacteria bacterium]
MKIGKMVLICLAVAVPVALGAFYYGRTLDPRPHAGEVHEEKAHGTGEHPEQEEEAHEAEHEPHGSSESETDHPEEERIRLSEEQIQALGIVTAKAGPGTLETVLTLPGEIILNDDRVAMVTPYVSGHVKEIRKRQGDSVRKGEVMAVLESRELADAGSAYLAARERRVLAEKNFAREESLWEKKITPEQDYLESKMVFAAARIQVRSARQKLMALGLSKRAINRLPQKAGVSLTRYEIVSPINGEVLEKNLSLGEMVEMTDSVYRVADMSTVWVRINLLQTQLPHLKKGMDVLIRGVGPVGDATGNLTFIGPLVGKETRTATGRATLSNPDGRWRPGLFVEAGVTAGEKHIPLLVPKRAVQRIGGKSVVFVPGEGGFEERVVTTGRSDENHVEITSGLSPEDRYVIDGAFELKATLMTDSMDSHAGHGH